MATRRDPVFHLRLPPELKAELQNAADAAHRSMNSEIVLRLIQSFSSPPSADGPDIPAALEWRLRTIEQQLGLFGSQKSPRGKKR